MKCLVFAKHRGRPSAKVLPGGVHNGKTPDDHFITLSLSFPRLAQLLEACRPESSCQTLAMLLSMAKYHEQLKIQRL